MYIEMEKRKILPNLQRYKLVLGSNSPRRRELLAGLDIEFEVQVIPGIDESYPEGLDTAMIPVYIAEKKAEAYLPTMDENVLLITADTIVHSSGKILGKPESREEAIEMLKELSGHRHEVVTGVCLTSTSEKRVFSVVSEVSFAALTEAEIVYYIDAYRPFDKAGGYGIQEWIGYIGVEAISGSFYNVMGLPVRRLYEELKHF